MRHIPFIRKIINFLYNHGIQITPRALQDTISLQCRITGKSTPVIFDVGAHTGCLAKLYRKQSPRARIYCFEPHPESFKILKKRFDADQLTVCHKMALSDSNGSTGLNVNLHTGTNSILATDPQAENYWGQGLLKTVSSIVVDTITLDTFCSDAGIRDIDILKIDVQGTELNVLAGARKMLQNHAISLVYLELIICPTYKGQHRLHEYFSLFDSYGYELLDLFNHEKRGNQLVQVDAVFLSSSFKKTINAL